MKADLKQKWVEALRSGEYEQADGALHDARKNSYCCLGVLCVVVGAKFAEFTREADDSDFGADHFSNVPVLNDRLLSSGEDNELTGEWCEEIGLPDQGDLIELNDGVGADENSPRFKRRHSFTEIADWIEANIPAEDSQEVNESTNVAERQS